LSAAATRCAVRSFATDVAAETRIQQWEAHSHAHAQLEEEKKKQKERENSLSWASLKLATIFAALSLVPFSQQRTKSALKNQIQLCNQ